MWALEWMKPGFLWICDFQLYFVRCKYDIWVQLFSFGCRFSDALQRSVFMQWPYWQEGLYRKTLIPFSWNFQEPHVFQPTVLLYSEKFGQELQHLPGATGGWKNWHKINETLFSVLNFIACPIQLSVLNSLPLL